MTEAGLLKNSVSRFLSESNKTAAGQPHMPEVGKLAASAQAIAKSNPFAVDEFKEKYPHLKEALEAALAFKEEPILKEEEQ